MARVTRGSIAAQEQAALSSQVAAREPVQLSCPPSTPGPRKPKSKRPSEADSAPWGSFPPNALSLPATLKGTRKRSRAAALKEEDVSELPHNLGTIPDLSFFHAKDNDSSPAKKPKESRATVKRASPNEEDVENLVAEAKAASSTSPKKAKKTSYGLTPGKSPYPDWPHPTPEECRTVCELLSTIHGEVKPPETIPPPSLTVTGCGEVPSVLDALIRTRLSAATTNGNSARAFAGLRNRFGVATEGIGKGSVDWNKVRLADTKDIFEAIKSGGLADVKSKSIKQILQMVWEENQARREQLLSEGAAPGSTNESSEEMKAEIERAEADLLSLDHLHLLPNEEAFNALTKYPGIGPKTASCVLLFCLRRPSFAVDTHVFRLCKWLGWVPPPGDPAGLPPGSKGAFTGPNERTTYAHCEVRVPDDLKYPLHQLFIKHGKTCPRCRAITGEKSEGWDKGCVIDHLVTRTGVRKGQGANPVKGAKRRTPKNSKAKAKVEDEEDAKSSDLSELGSDDDEFKPS
ncbi:DNA glycosylase [Lentithecium fluviatile CBS 122367]|uniref:DNA glycosylase n=1 Tax=Lentithecium fluviatile CBS 122367 TaxID=1168545 RepID=A0A6G1JHC1_9PLEO|nr:DNA glycosylase [Lentithecium fluviatile CBS 122367]